MVALLAASASRVQQLSSKVLGVMTRSSRLIRYCGISVMVSSMQLFAAIFPTA